MMSRTRSAAAMRSRCMARGLLAGVDRWLLEAGTGVPDPWRRGSTRARSVSTAGPCARMRASPRGALLEVALGVICGSWGVSTISVGMALAGGTRAVIMEQSGSTGGAGSANRGACAGACPVAGPRG